MVINEDTSASNCPAYLETFPEPGNEACQSLGFPHSDNPTYRDLARKAGPRFRETDALIGTNRRISVWAAVKHDVLGGRSSFVNLKPTQKSERVNSPLLRYLGWATFGVMTAAVVRMIITS